MALDDNALKEAFKTIADDMVQKEDYELAKEQYATAMVLAIKTYLMSSTIQITGTSNQGAFTGTGNIT